METAMETAIVHIDPEEVAIEDVEEFLATDDLFVEYFNTFLALPSFPEPVCFNRETGGFEVVSQAKKELVKQIKAAVRSQQRPSKIYRATKNHSYSDIPLIPIDEPSKQDSQEINTSFNVLTLNKEQGIHWVKAERLPIFLESDCYLEYRLGNVLSQVKLTGEHGQYVAMKIDFTPRVKAKKVEEEEPTVDPMAAMMKEMYVCVGNTSTTVTEAWFSTAKMAHDIEPTFIMSPRPSSAIGMVTHRRPDSVGSRYSRPVSGRPTSAFSSTDFHRHLRSDSGFGSTVKGSVFGSTLNISAYGGSVTSIGEEEELCLNGDLKPCTPRPSEPVCYISGDGTAEGGTVYMPYPKSENTDSESGLGDFDTDREDTCIDDDSSLFENNKTSENTKHESDLNNIEDLSSVIVATVLSHSIAQEAHVDVKAVQDIDEIRNLYPDKKYMNLTIDELDKELQFSENKEKYAKNIHNEEDKKDAESDVDSLLDSEDDFEEQDAFFRTHKNKKYALTSKRGIEQFKKFIRGTQGEILWNLWIDIDRSRQMKDLNSQKMYMTKLKMKYLSPGALYPLTDQMKLRFGLVTPEQWTARNLHSVQNRVAEPLVTYWGRKFLIKQDHSKHPECFKYMFNQRRLEDCRKDAGVLPTCTASPSSLLPLRPKSCRPRINSQTESPKSSSASSEVERDVKTSPPIGLKRTYSSNTLQIIRQLAMKNRHKELTTKTEDEKAIKEKNLLSPCLVSERKRTLPTPPPSKVSESRSTSSSRPKTASTIRPKSALSHSWETLSNMSHTHGRSGQDSKGGKSTSRCQSVKSNSSRGSSHSSEFLGGKRMEALLQTLHHEKESGGFFGRYVEKTNNQLWKNNLSFWRDVQEYHQAFFSESVDATMVQKKAKAVYSRYVVAGAPQDIRCSSEIIYAIYGQLEPPFDDLFDTAEEYAITVLYVAWVQHRSADSSTYGKVQLIEVKRHLETKSKFVLHLQKRGLISERVLTPDNPMEGYEDPVYDETVLEKIPEEFKEYSLDKLIHNRIELEHFRQFLADNYANLDLLCWMDIEAFRRIPPTEEKKRDNKAKDIKVKYLNKKYFFGVNSPAGKEGQDRVMEAGGSWGKLLDDRPANAALVEAQKYVQDRLEKKWLPQFLILPEFSERQKPQHSMDDVVDDVVVQRRQRSQAVSRLLENRWVTSSSDIITFRKALLNPVTSLQFRRYVSIKGDSLENDVLFWLEVQKYKEMHHMNTDDSIILHKVNAIINCFIDSQIPPSLQVDIPPEAADKIVDRKYERGPYLFREAQLTVFRELFAHWTDFCDYRSNMAADKVLPTIERQRRRVKRKEREKQQRLEEHREKEAARRQALGLPPEGEEEQDAFHDPFAAKDGGGSDGEEERMSMGGKESVSWTYSQYMSALKTEELFSNLEDRSSLSSCTETGSVKPTEKDDRTSMSAKTETTTKRDSKSDSPPSSKRSKKVSRTEVTYQQDPSKLPTANHSNSSNSSNTKKTEDRKSGTKKTVKTDGSTKTETSPTNVMSTTSTLNLVVEPSSNTKPVRGISRQMPPLPAGRN